MVSFKTVIFEVAPPCKQLEGFVSHFWYSRWKQGVQSYFCYFSTASINSELVFAFDPKNAYRTNTVFASFQGHTENHKPIETGGFSEMFGVSLYSHAVPFFFGVPANQLMDQLIDAKELLNNDVALLTNQLTCATNFTDRVNIMTHYLKLRMNKTGNLDLVMLRAIKRMREMRGQVDIRSMANDFSLSQKQFERRFKEFSSFNPKLYSSIVRFEASLLPGSKFDNYTDMALELGYYDQAHFINEFKRFSGFSPRKYNALTSY